MRKWIFILGIVAASAMDLFSQQAPLYSQYMLNGFLLNPAVAGSEGYTAVNLTAREQWVGFPKGPGTYALSFQTRVLRKSHISRSASVRRRRKLNSSSGRVGVGGYVFNHSNGAVEKIGIKGTYAYHIPLANSQLSFGLSLVAYQYRLDDDQIRLEIPDDSFWAGTHKSVIIPDADAGIYYNSRNVWAGFSVDQLFESVLKFGDAGYNPLVMERNYYMIGGYDFEVNRNWIITPSVFLKYADNVRLQADLSGKFYYQQLYWGGLTYRTGQAIILMAGVSVDRLIFGYAFDIGLGSIMKHSFGTHEFTFVARIGEGARRFRWMNRF